MKNSEIKILNSNIDLLNKQISKLNLEKNSLNGKLNAFIEGCKFLKEGYGAVRSMNGREFLKSHGIAEDYLGFNEVSNGGYSLEELYKFSEDYPKTISIIIIRLKFILH